MKNSITKNIGAFLAALILSVLLAPASHAGWASEVKQIDQEKLNAARVRLPSSTLTQSIPVLVTKPIPQKSKVVGPQRQLGGVLTKISRKTSATPDIDTILSNGIVFEIEVGDGGIVLYTSNATNLVDAAHDLVKDPQFNEGVFITNTANGQTWLVGKGNVPLARVGHIPGASSCAAWVEYNGMEKLIMVANIPSDGSVPRVTAFSSSAPYTEVGLSDNCRHLIFKDQDGAAEKMTLLTLGIDGQGIFQETAHDMLNLNSLKNTGVIDVDSYFGNRWVGRDGSAIIEFRKNVGTGMMSGYLFDVSYYNWPADGQLSHLFTRQGVFLDRIDAVSFDVALTHYYYLAVFDPQTLIIKKHPVSSNDLANDAIVYTNPSYLPNALSVFGYSDNASRFVRNGGFVVDISNTSLPSYSKARYPVALLNQLLGQNVISQYEDRVSRFRISPNGQHVVYSGRLTEKALRQVFYQSVSALEPWGQ